MQMHFYLFRQNRAIYLFGLLSHHQLRATVYEHLFAELPCTMQNGRHFAYGNRGIIYLIYKTFCVYERERGGGVVIALTTCI